MTHPSMMMPMDSEPTGDPAAGVVDGVYMDRSLNEFTRGCVVCLEEEHRQANPNNFLISLLCDAVRITRELTLMGERQEMALADCSVCHHTSPALRICSRCGPQCAACQQAVDAARYQHIRHRVASLSRGIDGPSRWYLVTWVLGMAGASLEAGLDTALDEKMARKEP